MSFGERTRFYLMCLVGALPFVLIILTFDHGTMITDSIPDHSTLLIGGWIAFFGVVAIINRHIVLQITGLNQIASALFFSGALGSILYLNNAYEALYQRHIFAQALSYNRAVRIDGIYLRDRRGGIDYYARINPNHIPTIQPSIKINADLYHIVKGLPLTASGSVSGSKSVGCLIRVRVDKAGSAERVEGNDYPDPSSIISCGGSAA